MFTSPAVDFVFRVILAHLSSPTNSNLITFLATKKDADEQAPIFFHAFHNEPFFAKMCPETPEATEAWKQAAFFVKDLYAHLL